MIMGSSKAQLQIFVIGSSSSLEIMRGHNILSTEEGPKKDVIAAGRYLDRFELRNDKWLIVHRKALYDWSRVDETKDGWANPPISEILERGQQGPDDLSYEFLKGLV